MHQQGAQGAAEVTLAADAHEVEGGRDVHHSPGVDVEPEALQDSPEQQQVVEEVGAVVVHSRHAVTGARSGACPVTRGVRL